MGSWMDNGINLVGFGLSSKNWSIQIRCRKFWSDLIQLQLNIQSSIIIGRFSLDQLVLIGSVEFLRTPTKYPEGARLVCTRLLSIYALFFFHCPTHWWLVPMCAALFQVGFPIYSSRFVRFRMGHPKSSSDIDRDFLEAQEDANDKFVWTYTSQTFPMTQVRLLRKDYSI